MSNMAYAYCDCGSRMYKIRAQSNKGDLPLGYYCPVCKAYQDNDRIYMVPITLLTNCDPVLKTAPGRAAYDAIIKAGLLNKDRAFYISHKQIDTARDQIVGALQPVCREKMPGEKIIRIDREKIRKELGNNFIKCFK